MKEEIEKFKETLNTIINDPTNISEEMIDSLQDLVFHLEDDSLEKLSGYSNEQIIDELDNRYLNSLEEDRIGEMIGWIEESSIDDFDTNDLVSELADRKSIDYKLIKGLSTPYLSDVYKFEYLMKIFSQYSEEEIEKSLPLKY